MKSICKAAAAKSLQSCPTLCNPLDSSPSGSTVPGILQARALEWVAISFSNAWKWKVKVKSLSRIRLSNPMDCSLPGSSIHGIFQARVMEWGWLSNTSIIRASCKPLVRISGCLKKDAVICIYILEQYSPSKELENVAEYQQSFS